MSVSTETVLTDRSDFRTVVVGGTKIGGLTAAAVILYLLAWRFAPVGLTRQVLEALVVLAGATAAGFLPAQWTVARRTEGIAGAAAMGLWGTVVFMAIDIVLLRPVKAYPWTWDAIGGGSTWWYLPIWWMLGTFVACMGAVRTAGAAARGEAGLVRVALPVLLGAIALMVVAQVTHFHVALPVGAGAGFTVTLAVLAIVALARRP